MAKQEAIYECVVTCTFNVPLANGETFNQLYRSAQETPNEDESTVAVPAGTVVPKHFIPFNDQAKKDRTAQIQEPEKFVNTKEQVTTLAEILVKERMFNSVREAEAAIKERAKEVGLDSDKFGESSASETVRIAAIDELLSRGNDDKERRKEIGKILKAGGVAYFAGAPPASLAAIVYDNDLYVAPKK